MKNNIEKIRIDTSFGLNEDQKVIWFMTEVSGKANTLRVLMSAMDVLEDTMKVVLKGNDLQDIDMKFSEVNKQDFKAILWHIQEVKKHMPGLGIDGALVVDKTNLGRQMKFCEWTCEGLQYDIEDLNEKLQKAIAEGQSELAVTIQHDINILISAVGETDAKWKKINDELQKQEKKSPILIEPIPDQVEDDGLV